MKNSLLFFLCLPFLAYSQTLLKPIDPSLTPFLEELMETANIPGMSIAIFNQEKVLYHKALGVKSMDTKDLVTDQTIFSAASLSKPVFGYAVLKLVEEGKIDLDKPLYQYMEYPDIADDQRYQKITARMVLSHTSGFPNWRNGALKILHPPGEKFQYSGEGFVYLMKVVEKITGKTLNTLADELVYQPLNMTHTSYIWNEKLEEDYAFPHDDLKRTHFKRKPDEGISAYSLQTNALDYSKFMQAIINGNGLSTATSTAMLDIQVEIEKAKKGTIGWGLGVGLQSTKEHPAFWHWGDNGTFKCFTIAFPKAKVGLVYFTNSSNGLNVLEAILKKAFNEEFPVVNWLDYPVYDSSAENLFKAILEQGFKEAIQPYLIENGPHQDPQKISEGQMNGLGYRFMRLKDYKTAKEIFKLNTLAHPKSSNVWDSYGEACLMDGAYEMAAKYYGKAAELDSDNSTAKSIVNSIQNPQTGNTQFILSGYSEAKHVSLAGAFNGWNSLSLPCIRKNGQWICQIDLEPGNYEYKFVVDRVWILDPANPNSKYSGNHNSVLEVK